MTTSNYPLFILYGSATGNSEHIAKDLASAYTKKYLDNNNQNDDEQHECFDSVVCYELDQFKKKCLPIWEKEPPLPTKKYGVLIVVSTTGNGEAPENSSRFVRYLKHKNTSKTTFQYVNYSVLGLGDTNYDQFCENAKIIDRKMNELNGHRILTLQCADEGTGCLEDVVDPWTDTIISKMIHSCFSSNSSEESKNNDDAVTSTSATTTTSSANTNPVIELLNNINEVVEREKKMEESSNNNNDSNYSNDDMNHSSLGVRLVQSLLLQQQKENNSLKLTSIHDLLSHLTMDSIIKSNDGGIDASSTVSSFHRTKSCTITDQSSDTNNDTKVLIRRSDTKESTDFDDNGDIYFSYERPYEANVIHARYLTKTNVDAAQQIAINSSHNNNKGEMIVDQKQWDNANQIIDKIFPLMTQKNDSSSSSIISDDTSCMKNSKRVIEMTLSLPEDNIHMFHYVPGDAIGMIINNTPTAVLYIFNILSSNNDNNKNNNIYDLQQNVMIHDPNTNENITMTIEQILYEKIDLCSYLKVTQTKRILKILSEIATDPYERNALQLLSSKKSSSNVNDPIMKYLYDTIIDEQRWNFIDIIHAFPSVQSNITIDLLLNVLPSIPPRYYSISSSPLVTSPYCKSRSLTIAFSAVDYVTPSLNIVSASKSSNSAGTNDSKTEYGMRRIYGLATRYLEVIASSLLFYHNNDMSSNITLPKVKIFHKPTSDFHLPKSLEIPIILIGPGTGIAPFIGFLQHRKALVEQEQQDQQLLKEMSNGNSNNGNHMMIDTTSNVGYVDLFFGCRHQNHDWLYENEMNELKENHIISHLHTAFSRDNVNENNNKNNKNEVSCDVVDAVAAMDVDDVVHHKYVQDIMKGSVCCQRIVDLILNHNASIYICGDGNQMAKDVQNTIVELLQSSTSSNIKNQEDALHHMNEMKLQQRFLLDIWS